MIVPHEEWLDHLASCGRIEMEGMAISLSSLCCSLINSFVDE